jgi:hypothetical protein
MNVILDVIAVIGAGCRGGLSDEASTSPSAALARPSTS